MSTYSDYKVSLANPNSTWTLLFDKISPGTKVLDVGCSSGYFARTLIEEKNCTVDGIELDSGDAETARQVCRKVVQANVEELDLSECFDQEYDHIVFADVLEHLIEPALVLNRMARITKPDGTLLFSIPNMAHASIRLQLLQGNFDYEDEGILDRTHLRFYTKKTIVELVERAGLYLRELDATTFDIPESIVNEALARVGLVGSEAFRNYLNTPDALVYQYLGVVVPAAPAGCVQWTDRTRDIKPRLNYEEQLKSVQDNARTFFRQLREQEKDNQGLRKQLQEQERDNQELRNQLQEQEKDNQELRSQVHQTQDLMKIYRIPGLRILFQQSLKAYRKFRR